MLVHEFVLYLLVRILFLLLLVYLSFYDYALVLERIKFSLVSVRLVQVDNRMLLLVQWLVGTSEEITDCSMVGHQVIEVFVSQLVGLVVLELPEKTCCRLELREAGTPIDFEGCRERLDFDPVLDVVGIALD